MNFIKRAITSIMRRSGKSLILLLLVFILGTVISGAIAVRGAVENTNDNLRRNMRPLVTFSMDVRAYFDHIEELGLSMADPETPEMAQLTAEAVRQIGNLPYIDFFEYSITSHLEVAEFSNYDVWGGEFGDDEWSAVIQLRGTSEPVVLQERENIIEITQGRTFEESELLAVSDTNPVIISSGFADVNGFSLGDTIEIPQRIVFFPPDDVMWDPDWDLNPENVFVEEIRSFEIIGIFDPIDEGDPIDLDDMSSEAHMALGQRDSIMSTFHVPNVIAEEMQLFHLEQYPLMIEYALENNMELPEWALWEIEHLNHHNFGDIEEAAVSSVMLINDPLDMHDFIEAAEEFLPDFWQVEPLAGGFDAISSSMETLQSIAFWVLVVAIGATLIVLSLLITLFLRDRRYEMGVYLALGERKEKIASQLLIEVVATAIIGITLAVFTGNIISATVSQNMLQNELAATAEDDEFGMGVGGGAWSEFDNLGFSNEMTPEEMLDAFDVSLNVETIATFYGVGIFTVVVSTLIPIVYVITLNPKKVLM